ncbi:histidine kinase A domain protein [Gemmatirosa kalamazoonensis]|uniref:histidine kinase n=1 Tax=Gemmatirosa kalamazoonensis TaxID=861299 RepID=W0RM98_9BACT|nr:GAF domain-containing protein [Gemmatirosa kalamazoonensis]AHG91592.1 histidine kinase A domain protein [Gemmatirosa kalamazoonensis]
MNADDMEVPEVSALEPLPIGEERAEDWPLLDRRSADRPRATPTDAETALRRAADRLARLQSVTASLAAAVDTAAIGDRVTDALLGATGAAAAALRVLARDADGAPVLRLVHARGYSDDMLAAADLPLDASTIAAEAARDGAPVFLESRADWERRFQPHTELHAAAGFEGAAALPCETEDVSCVLAISFAGPHPFDADERAMLQTMAEETAIALGRARLAERAARQARRFAFLADVSRALSMPTEVDETLALIARLPVPDLADYCIVYRLGADGRVHRVARAHADSAREAVLDALERHFPLDADSELPAARVMRTQQSVFSPRLRPEDLRAAAPDARYMELLDQLELRSGITIPLVARGRSLGAIVFARSAASKRVFDDDDRDAAHAFAERAALALDTTRLLAEARQAHAEAEVARAQAELARAQAEAASRAREDFVARMSHELRTPLNAIGGYAELIEMGVRGPVTEQQREDLRRLQRAQRHLLGLINQVLAYARAGSGGITYDITDVPIDDVLRSVEALIAPQIRAKGILYEYTPCDGAATLRADAVKLRQIVLNLLSNAVKFTEPGGRIGVQCELQADVAAIRVRDTGLGVPRSSSRRSSSRSCRRHRRTAACATASASVSPSAASSPARWAATSPWRAR